MHERCSTRCITIRLTIILLVPLLYTTFSQHLFRFISLSILHIPTAKASNDSTISILTLGSMYSRCTFVVCTIIPDSTAPKLYNILIPTHHSNHESCNFINIISSNFQCQQSSNYSISSHIRRNHISACILSIIT